MNKLLLLKIVAGVCVAVIVVLLGIFGWQVYNNKTKSAIPVYISQGQEACVNKMLVSGYNNETLSFYGNIVELTSPVMQDVFVISESAIGNISGKVSYVCSFENDNGSLKLRHLYVFNGDTSSAIETYKNELGQSDYYQFKEQSYPFESFKKTATKLQNQQNHNNSGDIMSVILAIAILPALFIFASLFCLGINLISKAAWSFVWFKRLMGCGLVLTGVFGIIGSIVQVVFVGALARAFGTM
jgi:hypothetical protein